MSLVSVGGMPLLVVGSHILQGQSVASALNVLQDAANEACIMYGRIWTEDGAAHTIDTTNSSSLGWDTGSVTFANAGTTFVVGLATLDTATGPPARATNVANVITFSVSKTLTGGGGGIAGGWNESVPDAGTMTIANGDLVAFCTQMTARGGADSIQTSGTTIASASPTTGVTSYVGGSYSASGGVPNAAITFADGLLGFFYGSYLSSGFLGLSYNSGSATNEIGNFLQLPFPATILGIAHATNLGGDADIILYSDPLGTPVAERTVSEDANVQAAANQRWSYSLFASPYVAKANQPLAAIVKPTTGTNVVLGTRAFNAVAHQKSVSLGANGYGVSRGGGSGAFAAVSSGKRRYDTALLVSALSQENAALINSPVLVG